MLNLVLLGPDINSPSYPLDVLEHIKDVETWQHSCAPNFDQGDQPFLRSLCK